jgi:hypothetical protein
MRGPMHGHNERMTSAAAPQSLALCPNCGAALATPRPRYCGDCGQETDIKAPTLVEFAQQFGGSYMAMEGALWRTLGLLLFKPGQLTLAYFVGRRRRYVLPLRLYLTISLLALLLLKVTGAVQVNIQGDPVEALSQAKVERGVIIDAGSVQVGLRQGQPYCEGLPESVCERAKRRLKLDPQSLSNELQEAKGRFIGHMGTAMFLLLPAFAMWMKLVFIDKRRRYTEHLVFALHLHAFWFAMLMPLMLRIGWLSIAAGLAMAVYPLIAIQRVYGTRWWSTGLRAATVALLNAITLSFVLMGVVLATVLL